MGSPEYLSADVSGDAEAGIGWGLKGGEEDRLGTPSLLYSCNLLFWGQYRRCTRGNQEERGGPVGHAELDLGTVGYFLLLFF